MKTHIHILDTEEGVFGFMYLMDEIKRTFFNNSILTDTNYQDIEIEIKNTSENVISAKTIGRAFNYRIYFKGTKPSNSTLDILTRHLTKGASSNFMVFVEDIEDGYLKEYPTEYKSIIDSQNKQPDEEQVKPKLKTNPSEDVLKAKQTNILSFFNSSIIGKIKGKISQFNFLGFGNKQEVNIKEKDKK